MFVGLVSVAPPGTQTGTEQLIGYFSLFSSA